MTQVDGSGVVGGVGRFGVWGTRAVWSPELAVAAERLGYGTVWIGGADGDLQLAERLLAATTSLWVATGIVNIWSYPPGPVAEAYHRLDQAYPGRFLLGIGVGHREAVGADYTRPYEAMVRYLDALDQAGVPSGRRLLAALGPRVLGLSADRSAGAHPYLTTPEHTRRAREILGPGVLLAPEQKVVLDPDGGRARALGHQMVPRYLGMMNYASNLRRLGYTQTDLTASGSDRLVDDLFVHGDTGTAAAAVTRHLEAGADHVAIQLLGTDDPLPGLAALAEPLFS